jgi:hypothetical protein
MKERVRTCLPGRKHFFRTWSYDFAIHSPGHQPTPYVDVNAGKQLVAREEEGTEPFLLGK